MGSQFVYLMHVRGIVSGWLPAINWKRAGRNLVWEQYEIIEALDEGAYGKVYLAMQTLMKRKVAIKVLSEKFASDEESRERFKREANIASSLDHPNIARTFAFGFTPDNNQPFLVMEFLEGRTLARYLQEHGKLNLGVFLDVFQQVLSGLQYAHDKGIIHRDIKPENIMLISHDDKIDVKILDFGTAKALNENAGKLTGTGILIGTPLYMSPEQCGAGVCDHRSDLYALGCVMFETICGRTPFESENALALIQKHLYETPAEFIDIDKHLKLPPGLVHLIYACLSKAPDRRPQSAATLRAELAKACLQKPVRIKRVSAYKDHRFIKKLIIAGISACIILAIGLELTRQHAKRLLAEKRASEREASKNKFLSLQDLKSTADELLLANRLNESRKKFQQLLDESRNVSIPRENQRQFNIMLFDAYPKLAESYLALNDLDHYRSLMKESIDFAGRAFGENSQEKDKLKYDLLTRLADSGKYPEEAERLAEEILSFRETELQEIENRVRTYTVPHQDEGILRTRKFRMAQAKSLLGQVKANQHKDKESIELLEHVLQTFNELKWISEEVVWVRYRLCVPLTRTNSPSAGKILNELLVLIEDSPPGLDRVEKQIILSGLSRFYASRKESKRQRDVLKVLLQVSETDFGKDSAEARQARRLLAACRK